MFASRENLIPAPLLSVCALVCSTYRGSSTTVHIVQPTDLNPWLNSIMNMKYASVGDTVPSCFDPTIERKRNLYICFEVPSLGPFFGLLVWNLIDSRERLKTRCMRPGNIHILQDHNIVRRMDGWKNTEWRRNYLSLGLESRVIHSRMNF